MDTWVDNLEGAGQGEFYTLDNSEGTRVGNKLDIYDGEVTGTTLGFLDRKKLGGDEGSGQVLSGGSFEGEMDGNLEYGIKELEDSAL